MDALRFLTQNLGQAFDLALETRDTRYPAIHAFVTPHRKLGGDCADFTYQQAWIDGESVYRITGNAGLGPLPELHRPGAAARHHPGHRLAQPARALRRHSRGQPLRSPAAHRVGRELRADHRRPGPGVTGANWLPTTPGSRKLFLRQGFDRWDEEPARFRIERVDMEGPRPLPTTEVMVEAIDWAGRFVTGLMGDWPEHPYRYSGGTVDAEQPNVFPGVEDAGASDQKRGRAAAHMCWQLAPDQALDRGVREDRRLLDGHQRGSLLQQHGLPLPPRELHAGPLPGRRRRHGAAGDLPRRSRGTTTGWTPRASSRAG